MVTNSKRGEEFIDFSKEVVHHIDNYTVPQYGDAPNDMVEEWNPEHITNQIQKYAKRMQNNGRGDSDNILSCLKIAHYACILHGKLKSEHEKQGE